VVVSISISGSYGNFGALIIDRTTEIIVPSAHIAVGQMIVVRQPAGVDPAIAAVVIIPVTRYPVGARVRRYFPMPRDPYIIAIAVIPRPVSVNPDVVGRRSDGYGRLDRQHHIGR
jgi:hypothetical protein